MKSIHGGVREFRRASKVFSANRGVQESHHTWDDQSTNSANVAGAGEFALGLR